MLHPSAPPADASSPNVIQLTKYAKRVRKHALRSGARIRIRKNQWLRVNDMKRSKLGWFSRNIHLRMGIPPKPPAGSICQKCGHIRTHFELDHMTPWRHYIAVMSSRKYAKQTGGTWKVRSDVAKALYNDPENLWWICRECNRPKTDIIPDSSAHAGGDFSTGTLGRTLTASDNIN